MKMHPHFSVFCVIAAPSPPFLMPSSPLPQLYIHDLSFLWIASLLIRVAYALPCLSYLLPPPHPPLQPSLYYPFIDSLSFFPTQHSIIYDTVMRKINRCRVIDTIH